MKLIGFLLVVLGSAAFGCLEAYSLRLRHTELLDAEQSFVRLESEVCQMLRPLPEALRRSGTGRSEELFLVAAEGIESGKDAARAWGEALDEWLKTHHLTLRDAEVLERFGEGINAEDTEGQKKNISLLRTLLSAQANEAEEASKKQGKLYGSGGVLVGLMIGIILL